MRSNRTKRKCKWDDDQKPNIDLVDYDKHKTQKISQKHFDIDYGNSDDEFHDSSDNIDPGEENGNEEDHLENLT